MPRGWRWTLGLGLAFLSGVVAALAIAVVLPQAISVPIVIAAGVLALAAGFVFSTWWAPLLLVGATAIGAWVTILMFDSGDSEVFGWFVILGLLPLFVGLLVGVGIGRWRRVGTI